MERWVNSMWYGKGGGAWLLPLSWLFGALAALRRFAFRIGLVASHRLPVPVIVVGNLTAGGTGKTPLCLWLVQQLAARGIKVGVVLRGFGSGSGHPRTVTSASAAHQVGDEALLIYERGQCLVAVGSDRVAAARLLMDQGVRLIIADDGLQHLRLARDVEIAVVDGARGFGNGRLLPAGPLREKPQRLASVGAVVINGAGGFTRAGALTMTLAGTTLRPVRESPVRDDPGAAGDNPGAADRPGAGDGKVATGDRHRAARELTSFAGQTVHAVAGIGNPARFFAALRAGGLTLIEHHFGDHHAYGPQELRFGDALPVLMTEKDAVKCRAFAGANVWYLPVDATFSDTDAQALLGRIALDTRLLDIMACPLCKGPLHFDRKSQVLVCRPDRLAFPIRDGVPVMLEEEARILQPDDPLLQV